MGAQEAYGRQEDWEVVCRVVVLCGHPSEAQWPDKSWSLRFIEFFQCSTARTFTLLRRRHAGNFSCRIHVGIST